MAVETPILRVRGLEVGFGARRAVASFDLDIAPGEIVGLTGDTGAGKSTLGLALLGLTRPPGRILGGVVELDGTDVLALDEAQRRRVRGAKIGLIVQNPRASLSPLHPVGRQIADAYRTHEGGTRAAAAARAVDMLRVLGLNDPERRVHAYPHEISGGMAQRVLIAIALGSGPRLLVADEPTSGLDVTIQAQFLDDMWHSVRRAGSAALLMTQDLSIIANYCDRVVVMQDGRRVEDAPTPRFFAAPVAAYGRSLLSLHREAPPVDGGGPVLLSVRGLRKVFPLRRARQVVQAVDGVSFDIRRGETLGLVGESGSGKTTVGRCLLRLIEPDGGEVVFDGVDVTRAGPTELRRLRSKLLVVFQDPFDSLDPRWTVADIIAEATEDRPDPGVLANLLRDVGLGGEVAQMKPRALSLGAQQRVNIARAIAVRPALIVLDEPTSALTPLARVGIIHLLRDLQARLHVSYLFISHDLSTVEHLSHRVAVMYLGQIVELGTRAQIFEQPRHPYSKALLAAHLVADPSRRRVDRPQEEALVGESPSPIDLPPGCFLAGRCPRAEASCRAERQELALLADGRSLRCGRVAATLERDVAGGESHATARPGAPAASGPKCRNVPVY
jgi:peptide/nickel transport system ATP-binding protein